MFLSRVFFKTNSIFGISIKSWVKWCICIFWSWTIFSSIKRLAVHLVMGHLWLIHENYLSEVMEYLIYAACEHCIGHWMSYTQGEPWTFFTDPRLSYKPRQKDGFSREKRKYISALLLFYLSARIIHVRVRMFH